MNFNNKILQNLLKTLFISIICFFIAYLLYLTDNIKRIEDGLYDFYFRMVRTGNPENTKDVAIVVIDELSLIKADERLGIKYPWPRNIYSMINNFILADGAKAIVYDFVFSDADFNRVEIAGLRADYEFYQSINNKRSVLAINIENKYQKKYCPEFIDQQKFDLTLNKLDGEQKEIFQNYYDYIPQLKWYQLNYNTDSKTRDIIAAFLQQINFFDNYLPIENVKNIENIREYKYIFQPYSMFTINNKNFGFVDTESDKDGVYREYMPLVKINKNYVPSLALATYLTIDKTQFPDDLKLNKKGRYIINWYGKGGVETNPDGEILEKPTFDYYSAWYIFLNARAKLINKEEELTIPPGTFKDKVVFIGGSARGLLDQKNTPFTVGGNAYPGVEIHATAYLNLKNQDWIKTFHPFYEFLFYLLITFIITYLGLRTSSLSKYIFFVVATFLAIIAGQFLAFSFFDYKTKILFYFMCSVLAFIATLIVYYITIGRSRKQIINAFDTYVSPDILKKITDVDQPLSTSGEKK
ncbi:MAG: CHASE2 domain-containing protein, partial [Spirochaetes bacterium]|nr:CHASE2 domain-containing protein [Spirochaetota bacterium]